MRTRSARRLGAALLGTLALTALGPLAQPPVVVAAGSAAAAPGWQLRWAPDARGDGLRAFEWVEEDRANSHPATIGDAPDGRLRWVVRNGASTVIDTTRTGVDTWLEDRVRPKWGIYRSLGDTSGSLQDCYLLLRNLRAYEWSASPAPPTSALLEAENAAISGGVVRSNRKDYTGTGFVDYNDAAGGSVEWKFNSATAGRATLTFRYANGSTSIDRPMDIRVNGAVVAPAHKFKYTLSWDEWDTRTVNTSLVAGVNTVRATATTGDGGPNLDNVLVQVTAAPAPDVARYEAESATISRGVVESNQAGYSGTGFVNYDNVAGSAVEFTVDSTAAGSASLTFRYANGTTVSRPMDVSHPPTRPPPAGSMWDLATYSSQNPTHFGATARCTAGGTAARARCRAAARHSSTCRGRRRSP